jgi:hypothetical protein
MAWHSEMECRLIALGMLALASTARAAEGDYCSAATGELAIMSWDDNRSTMTTTENRKTETWIEGTTVGTGLNGRVYEPENGGDIAVLYSTTILMDSNVHEEPTILIFKDRVFWPCYDRIIERRDPH